MVDYKSLDQLCRASIDDYDDKVRIAWGCMDRMRCPLSMAFPGLYDEIVEVLDDNEIDWENLDIEEIISC